MVVMAGKRRRHRGMGMERWLSDAARTNLDYQTIKNENKAEAQTNMRPDKQTGRAAER